MEALNNKERNSAILRFAMWLFISVIIISVPVIFTAFFPVEQKNIEAEKSKDLLKEIAFEKEFMAENIRKIMTLMESKEAKKIDVDSFNAELMNIISDIEKETETMTDWRGDMYRNIKSISEYLVSANKVMSSSADNKDKQINDLNKILLDFESIGEKISDLADQKKKKDIQAGLDEVKEQYNKAVKMLNNYKSLIK